MDLYIANATKQILQFEFRLADKGRVSRTIGSGGQTVFSGLKQEQIDRVIYQHRRYNMLPLSEVMGARSYVAYFYSIDRPIKPEVIAMAAARNDGVLVVQGRETRKRLAIAINDNLGSSLAQNNSEARIRGFDLSVVEEEPRTGYHPDIKPVGERISVDLSGQMPPPQSAPRRRGRPPKSAGVMQ
jgi:hypothetical protein